MRIWALLLVASSCTSSSTDTELASLGSLEFSIPSGWHASSSSPRHAAAMMWIPDNNENQESVVILSTPPMLAISNAGSETIRSLLEKAQGSLPAAAFGRPLVFRSSSGLRGARTEGTYIPPGKTGAYRRMHAVLLEGTSLVHVIYTAGVADADTEAFHIVINSLHRKQS